LHKVLAHGVPVVHGVEARYLVDAHGGHLEDASHLVHDAEGSEAELALAKVEDGHDSRLLVLRGVALEYLGDDGLVLGRELEGDVGVVFGRVSVLFFMLESRPALGMWSASCIVARLSGSLGSMLMKVQSFFPSQLIFEALSSGLEISLPHHQPPFHSF
jgi:hypothetical protein